MPKLKFGNLYWRVTYGCNLNCFMCLSKYSNESVVRGYEKKLLEEARELKFKTIVFTGGEPTLRKDLPKLIRQTTDCGFNVRLDTNGMLADKAYLASIKNSLYLLGLPLHGSVADLHDSIAGFKGAFNIIKDRAEIARELEIPLKITTAVSRKNIEDVEKIADYLNERIHPDIYALVGMVKRSMDAEIFNECVPSEQEFDAMKNRLLKNDYPFKLSFCSGHKESDRAYIFINPDFSVSIAMTGTEKIISDLKIQNLKSILAKTRIDYKLHLSRFEATNL